MQIFINNEEVVCSQKMTIEEPLVNTKSVILNNVYPKSWEIDKDYVSRFYMPKDYSKVQIVDEEHASIYTTRITTWSINNYYLDIEQGKIVSRDNCKMMFAPILSNTEYILDVTNYGEPVYLYGANDYRINNEITPIIEIPTGRNQIKVSTAENMIVLETMVDGQTIITVNSLTRVGKVKRYNMALTNVIVRDNRVLSYSDSKIMYSTNYKIKYMKVVPNREYLIRFQNSVGPRYICETDDLNIGTTAQRLQYISYSSGSAPFKIKPTKKYLVWSSEGDMLEAYYDFSTANIFNGYIKNSGNINLNPRYPHYSTLQALDYENFLSECDTLNFVLEKQTVSSAIKKIIENLNGFWVGTIELEEDSEIAPYNCNNKTPFDVLEYLAEITGSIWYSTTYDENMTVINFRSPDKCIQTQNIEYTQDFFEENEIVDIKYSFNTRDYRNKQTIINENAISGIPQVEQLTYNGQNIKTTFPISSIVSIKVGNKSLSFALYGAESTGKYANIYYSNNNNELTINSGVSIGTVLTITYYSIVNVRQVAYNQSEVDRISSQTGSTGIISRYEKRTDTDNEEALSKIAQSYIDYKGVPEITLQIITTKDLFVTMGGRKVFFNAPIESLKTNYLLINKEIEMITTGDQQKIFYTYKLSSSFNDENAINYFDNQRRKLEGTISEGEYIPRYVDLPSSTNIIFYDLTIEEIEEPQFMLDAELDIEFLNKE